ncbi:MAG: hypothetical protein ACFFBD_01460 [Candidatus Hodarchaeota archaeon]
MRKVAVCAILIVGIVFISILSGSSQACIHTPATPQEGLAPLVDNTNNIKSNDVYPIQRGELVLAEDGSVYINNQAQNQGWKKILDNSAIEWDGTGNRITIRQKSRFF